MAEADPIYVTRPSLPDIEELFESLRTIWSSRILSNSGPYHERLESALSDMFGNPVSLVSNGMTGLSCSLEALRLEGEVVTTPYSFVATTHALLLARLRPVFADVRLSDCNIDPAAVERAITPTTRAILAVHCYGNPCDTEALADIAKRHGLALIYDAAHAFGVTVGSMPLVCHGDYSVLSFHATKAFNTFEGGAVVSPNDGAKRAIDLVRNFGIEDEVTISAIGTNAKMNEFSAAIGLLQLDRYDVSRASRESVDRHYRSRLSNVPGLALPKPIPGTIPNYSYFPIFVESEFRISRDELYERLKMSGIFARRYFYPCLAELPMYRDLPSANPANLPVSFSRSAQVLCLPIYEGLEEADVERIVDIILGAK